MPATPDEMRPHVIGIYTEYAGGVRWVCSCGAESRKAADRWVARERGQAHARRARAAASGSRDGDR